MEDFAKKVSISEPETINMENQAEEKQEKGSKINTTNEAILGLLRRFLAVQQRRALAYARLKRVRNFPDYSVDQKGFEDYRISGGELAFQQLCSEITLEFNDCSKQVLEMESIFASPAYCREDLAGLLRSVQVKEKEKLNLALPRSNPQYGAHAPFRTLGKHNEQFRFAARDRLDIFLKVSDNLSIARNEIIDCRVLHTFVFPCSKTATIQVLKKAGRPSERLVSHENCRFTQSTGHECMHIQQITEESGTEEAEADSEYDNALKEAVQGIQDAVTSINEYLEEVRYEIAALEDE
ncbi:hypothetical protein SASPL_123027 [Salvia splendens]|uniref:Uncharacterized protein n=1 Tax=Salvia splendens TaxID=180675 RepID=A0A8X8XN83_SALSN|nr:hypothetical protein SASPL_123027 [Salvia splendens]